MLCFDQQSSFFCACKKCVNICLTNNGTLHPSRIQSCSSWNATSTYLPHHVVEHSLSKSTSNHHVLLCVHYPLGHSLSLCTHSLPSRLPSMYNLISQCFVNQNSIMLFSIWPQHPPLRKFSQGRCNSNTKSLYPSKLPLSNPPSHLHVVFESLHDPYASTMILLKH